MLILFALLTAFVIVLMITPGLIVIARERNIFDEPGERKVHTSRTPLLGGISIFTGTLISFLFWGASAFEIRMLFVLVSFICLFTTGLLDDLRPIAPRIKLFFQIVAAFITVAFSGLAVTGMHGLFGMHSLQTWLSIPCSVFFVLLIINAFNFIDGIDGLAAAIGILCTTVLGALFVSIGDTLYATLSFSLCGSLVAFSFFNFSPAKIFMGDAGTLITGFILSLLSIQLTEETRIIQSHWVGYESAPVFCLALLIVPVTDFIRVTILRLLSGQSPVRADKNHIHHVLVKLGLNHLQIVGLLLGINFLFISMALLFRHADQSLIFSGMILSGLFLSQVPYLMLRRKTSKATL